MKVDDLFRDRMTKPNPVLNPLFEPKKLDGLLLVMDIKAWKGEGMPRCGSG